MNSKVKSKTKVHHSKGWLDKFYVIDHANKKHWFWCQIEAEQYLQSITTP